MKAAKGKVIFAFGNLVHVAFEGDVRQGEICYVQVENVSLKAEVIEIQKGVVKAQVFEDLSGVKLGNKVTFTKELLEAELGPGLLTSIFDGLQNPLEKIADEAGNFLPRGLYIPSLDRKRKWEFHPGKNVGEVVKRGDSLGTTQELHFSHHIMVPFVLFGTHKITWMARKASYTIEEVIAKLEDQEGQVIEVTMLQRWPVKFALQEGEKQKPKEMMSTGERVIDTQFPVLKGGTFCSPGPFGAGKTVLQHHLSKYSNVDIVIVCACGERAGEVVDMLKTFPHLIDPHTGESLMTRTVIICNTSSMPVAAREASIYMGATIAEYYRQMGLHVLLLADSTSRWAQALREMSGRLEEIPGEEAFPAYLASRIASFYERAGVLSVLDGKVGSMTIGATVSPAGGNFEEPVTQATLSVVGAFLGLSRVRSDARRYPAIDPLISWSKYLSVTSKDLEKFISNWEGHVRKAHEILQMADEIQKRMEVVGEEGVALEDMIIYLKGELYDFCYLQQNAFDKVDTYCPMERQLELFSIMIKIFEMPNAFEDKDQARDYFLILQNEMKNFNYLSFKSEAYTKQKKQILKKIEEISLDKVRS
ncbi:MAG: V-type sodium ATPase catalytic subunit A [Chlamydiae bacterium]|nr:V-type sodium ATPase catalytic subunit A [Chlamydiota bacterium]